MEKQSNNELEAKTLNENRDLKNILQAHSLNTCLEVEAEFYMETNMFYESYEFCLIHHNGDKEMVSYKLKERLIVKTEDGYVEKNIV